MRKLRKTLNNFLGGNRIQIQGVWFQNLYLCFALDFQTKAKQNNTVKARTPEGGSCLQPALETQADMGLSPGPDTYQMCDPTLSTSASPGVKRGWYLFHKASVKIK